MFANRLDDLLYTSSIDLVGFANYHRCAAWNM